MRFSFLQVKLMLNYFRAISILEGLSFLAILSVTLGFISRDFVFQIGMTHGILFMLYLFLSLIVSNNQEWSLKVWFSLLLASIIPFAFIPAEFFMSKSQGYQKAVEG